MNNISIFSPFGEFKSDFKFDNFEFNRDLKSRKTSKINIWNLRDKNISIYDIFKIYNFLGTGLNISGLVIEINNITNSDNLELILAYGADTYLNTIYIEGNSQQPNDITVNNGTVLDLRVVSDSIVTANDELLTFDTVCRQLMRRGPMIESYDLKNNIVTISDNLNGPIYNFIEMEPTITNIRKEIAVDSFDKLVIYLDSDKTQSLTGYFTNGVYSTIPEPNYIYTELVEIVMIDNFKESYIKNKLKSQSYNNKFEFETLLHNQIKPLIFSEDILGRKVKLYLKNGGTLETIISAYQIKNEFTIKYTLGLTRSRLSDIITSEKGE